MLHAALAAFAVLLAWAPIAGADTARILDVGDSWAFFPYALQSPPALEEVLARPEFGLDGIREDGSIGLTSIFAEGWDTPEQLQKVTDRLNALKTLDICHVSLGGNDWVHGWKRTFTPEQTDALFDTIVGHVRNVVQHCLDQRPDVRVAVVGYDYINLFDGFKINALNQVWDYESITHWAVTYWGYDIPQTKQQVLDIVAEVHEVWLELERRKLEMVQEFDGRVTYIHNFGYVQRVHGVPSAGLAPNLVPVPDGPANGYANFPNGRADLYNPREVMKIDDGEMDPLHLSPVGFLTYYENVVRQCYFAWLSDSTPPQVSQIRPLPSAENPTDAATVVFEVTFSEPVTGVDLTDFSLRMAGGVAGGSIASLSGSGTTYQVTVEGLSGAGTAALDLIDDDSIYDAVWYPLRRLDDGSFTQGTPYWLGGGLLGCVLAPAIEAQGAALAAGPLAADWAAADLDADAVPDRFSAALLARLLCDAAHPQHAAAQAAFDANRAALEAEAGFAGFAAQADGAAALITVSAGLRDAVVAALSLAGAYVPFEADGHAVCGGAGDPDGDERSNLLEYDWVAGLGAGPVAYAIAASTPGVGPAPGPACPDPGAYDAQAEDFYIVLNQGVTWDMVDLGESGIPDRYELALLAHVLCDGDHPLHDALQLVYEDNLAELAGTPYEPYDDFLALFAALSQETAGELISALTLTANLSGFSFGGEEPFDDDSDLDEDGDSNRREYIWTLIRGGSPEVYAEEAANPLDVSDAAIPNCDFAFTFETQGEQFYDFAFQVGAWQIADVDQSTIPDRYELAVLAALLCDDTYPGHVEAMAAYEANLDALRAETAIPFLAPVLDIMAAVCTVSQPIADLIVPAFGLGGSYNAFRVGESDPLGPLGDIDGDTRRNFEEFEDIGGLDATAPEYVRAVLGALYPPAPVLEVPGQYHNVSQPIVSGAVRYALEVEWSLDGVAWLPAQVDGELWSFVPPDPLPDGVYDVHLRATGAFNRDGTDATADELAVDTIAPEILLNGDARLTAEAGEPYADPGAVATDDREGDITQAMTIVNNVDTALIDTFSVLYNVRDQAGNQAQPVQRIVDVRDRTKPLLELIGPDDLVSEAGVPFDDPGVIATDTFDAEIESKVIVTGAVDHTVLGVYLLQYGVRDAYRNDADPVSRQVEVADTLPPAVFLVGGTPITVPASVPFDDPGATAFDVFEGIVSERVERSGDIDVNVPGSYELVYAATDTTGNLSAPIMRTVIVTDQAPPVITVTGGNPLAHEAATPYTDPGATAFDAVEGDLTSAVQTGNGVNASALGSYTVQYSVTDGAGNAAQAVRTVNVVDTTPPIITLAGDANAQHELGFDYDDPGAAASDTRQGDLSGAIAVSGSVDGDTSGVYALTYNVADSEGNAAEPVVRTVTVADTRAPIITLIGGAALVLSCRDPYVEPGAAAFDEADGNLSAQVAIGGFVDPATPGVFELTYTVSDAAGNAAAPKTRTVEVVDDCSNSADSDGNFRISLSELLRVIQFYNLGVFQCVEGTEDGYGPGIGSVACGSHDADYSPADWVISLSELLRIVQFYNGGGVYPCPGAGTEDGFCLAPL